MSRRVKTVASGQWSVACKRLLLLAFFWTLATSHRPLVAQSPIFPDQIGMYQKSAPKTLSIPDRPLYDEYGLDATESAVYMAPDKKHFTATAWRMHDSTGALALFEYLRPPGAVSSNIADLAVRASDGLIFVHGNYVFQITGGLPEMADLPAFYSQLPKFENSPLPALASDLPSDGLVPNSGRYILGPVSLQRFEPAIPPSTAAFHLGAEAQLGKYKVSTGILTLTIFDYPTPNMARQQTTEFQKIPNGIVKRTGPLVAIIIAPPDPDAAERILAKVNYQANVTENEPAPTNEIKGFAGTLLNIFLLAGILISLAIAVGIGFGGFRILARKLWKQEDPHAMIVLHLDKP